MARSASPTLQQIDGTASCPEPAKKTKKKHNTHVEPRNLPPDSDSKSASSPTVPTDDAFAPELQQEKKQRRKKEKTRRRKEEAPLIPSVSEKVSIASLDSNNTLEGERGRIEERKKRKRIKEDPAVILADSEKAIRRERNDILDGEVRKRKQKKRSTKNEDLVAEVSPDLVTVRTRKDEATAKRLKRVQDVSFDKENGGTIAERENDTDEGNFAIETRSDKDRKSKKEKLGWSHIDNGSAHRQPERDSRNEIGCTSGTEKNITRVVSGSLEKGEGEPKADISNCSHRARGEENVIEDEDQNNLNRKKTKKKKKVSFEDQHINRPSDMADADDSVTDDGEVEIWGIRFTPEEDELLKQAVFKYIKEQGWNEKEGLEKVLNCKKYKEAKNCWGIIKASLPNRPRSAIRLRGHLLLQEGTHLGRWSQDEVELLKSLQAKYGKNWKMISSALGRYRTNIKEKWRTLKRGRTSGKWSQKELQQLSDLVHKCYRMKALMGLEKKSTDRHILIDDINWEKIADDIGTHGHGACCGKWYYNLCSSMVRDGIWANEDDVFLLKSLLESGACAEEEVEWNKLLAHRAGSICLTRWKQMGKHLGENISRPFLDKLDILVKRYAPELLENDNNE